MIGVAKNKGVIIHIPPLRKRNIRKARNNPVNADAFAKHLGKVHMINELVVDQIEKLQKRKRLNSIYYIKKIDKEKKH